MRAVQAQYAEPAAELAPAVRAALDSRGVARLFSHQAQAVDSLLQASAFVTALAVGA